jgi:hypothetical protein
LDTFHTAKLKAASIQLKAASFLTMFK